MVLRCDVLEVALLWNALLSSGIPGRNQVRLVLAKPSLDTADVKGFLKGSTLDSRQRHAYSSKSDELCSFAFGVVNIL